METARVISVPTTPQPAKIFVEKHGYMTPDEIVRKFYNSRCMGHLDYRKVTQAVTENPVIQQAVIRFEHAKYRAEQKARWDRNKRMGRKFVNKH